jgi:hypothetical protein
MKYLLILFFFVLGYLQRGSCPFGVVPSRNRSCVELYNCSRCPPAIGSALNQFTIFDGSSSTSLIEIDNTILNGLVGSLGNMSSSLNLTNSLFNGYDNYTTSTDSGHYLDFNDTKALNASLDLADLVNRLKNCTCMFPLLNTLTGVTFTPGKSCAMNLTADLSISGNITFDANYVRESYFIIYNTGNIVISPISRFILKRGAQKENIFIFTEDTMGVRYLMDGFGTFISVNDMIFGDSHGDGIKLFSINGQVAIGNAVITSFTQDKCSLRHGACRFNFNCRLSDEDSCVSSFGEFSGHGTDCSAASAIRFQMPASRTLGIGFVIGFGVLALVLFLCFCRQGRPEENDLMNQ